MFEYSAHLCCRAVNVVKLLDVVFTLTSLHSKVTDKQLPKLKLNDPVARYYGLKREEVTQTHHALITGILLYDTIRYDRRV